MISTCTSRLVMYLILFEYFTWEPMICIMLIYLSEIHSCILNNIDIFYKHELYPK